MSIHVKLLNKPLSGSYSPENLISQSKYDKKMLRIKAISSLIILAAIAVSTAGVVATVLTGCLPLVAIPIATILLSIVLLKVVYKLSPRVSPVPLGFAQTDPDGLFSNVDLERSSSISSNSSQNSDNSSLLGVKNS